METATDQSCDKSPHSKEGSSSDGLSESLRLSFSTLGCPNWELERIAQAARAYGYAAVELRAIGGELGFLERPEFQPGTVEATPLWLGEQSISICCVVKSCELYSLDSNQRCEQN